jgi:hypothetical protein
MPASEWRKSSYTGDNGDCVEVAWPDQRTAVRDSKQPAGPSLAFPTDAWRRLVTELAFGGERDA